MAGLITDLIETLQGQTELFKQVIALSEDKKNFIIKNDIENLREIVKQENQIVPKALKGDKTRERLMKDISTVLNTNHDELTFASLAELISGQPEHPAFVQAAKDFELAAQEMKEQNDNNKLLLQDALDYIEFNMNIIHSSIEAQPAGYGDLLDNTNEPGSFLDTRS